MGRVRGGRLVRGRLIAAAAVLLITAGCGLLGDRQSHATGSAPVAGDASAEPPNLYEEATPEPEPTDAEPSRSTPARKPTAAEPTRTEDPNNFTEPECATHQGKNVTKKAAKAALLSAAGRSYWPTSAPRLKVPADLIKAVAWHESGWQSNIVNCDGGRGLMQVMPDTEEFVNNRFEKSYDARDYRQNATLGANYLAWLTKYFGDNYFKGDYSLRTSKCKSHESRCLLNLVIAGYNAGAGTVDAAYAAESLPNPDYVNSVRHLMKSCYCDRY